MTEAFSLIEVMGLSTAMVVADAMLKAGEVRMRGIKIRHGSGHVALTLSGETASAQAAHAAGVETAKALKKLFAQQFIAAPDPSIDKLIELGPVGKSRRR